MNLEKHIENIQKYGVPVVVTLNSFVSDTEAENEYIRTAMRDIGKRAAVHKRRRMFKCLDQVRLDRILKERRHSPCRLALSGYE